MTDKRNWEILREYDSGVPTWLIASKYGIQEKTIKVIIRNLKWIREHYPEKEQEMYADTDVNKLKSAINGLNMSEHEKTALYRSLRGAGVCSLSALKRVPMKELKRFRNMGQIKIQKMLAAGLIGGES